MTVDRSTAVRAKWWWPTATMLVAGVLTGTAAAWAGPGPEVGPPAPAAQVQPASAPAVPPALARERATPLGPAASTGSPAAGASDPNAPAARGAAPVGGVLDMALPLAVVLAAILLVAWLTRWVMSKGNSFVTALGPGGRAPSGVIEVLGRYPVARGQMLVLVKLDRRVLLLGHTSPARGLRGGLAASGGGFSTLCDIDDPEQVASILWKVQEGSGEGTAQRFSELLRGRDAENDAASGLTIESDPIAGPPVSRRAAADATPGARLNGVAAGPHGRGRAGDAGDTQAGNDPWAGVGGSGRSRDAATDLRQRLERLRLTGRGSGDRGAMA